MKMHSLTVFAAVVAVTQPTLALAQPDYGHGYGPHMMWAGGLCSRMILGPLIMILVLVLAVALAVYLMRRLGGPWHGQNQAQPALTPLDLLKERFARGEIDKDEFEERRRILGD